VVEKQALLYWQPSDQMRAWEYALMGNVPGGCSQGSIVGHCLELLAMTGPEVPRAVVAGQEIAAAVAVDR
jgi:hypothetical protein